MEKENLQENQIRGETVNQQGQFDGMLRNSLMGYEGQSLEQALPEPPQTFVLECNKVNAQPDGDSYSVDESTGQVDGRPNSWTNTFPPIKLKKGDQVSVNSAFLSSRGGGDLLQFDTSNNKTRVLFEYYSVNDKTNGKRSSIDIKGSTYDDANPYELNFSGTDDGKQAYIGEQFNFPANYRPMPLYRLMDTFLTAADFQDDPPDTTDQVQFTLPTFKKGTPFYSRLKEANWGWQTGADYLLDSLEDSYVPGLVRTPKIKINETMFYQDNNEGTAADYSPLFGTNLPSLSIWYVSTRASLLGPCSEEATMRIYFPFGKIAGTNFNQSAIDAMTMCKKLRPGDTIQFGNSEAGVGVFAQRAPLKGNQSANGGPPTGFGSQLNFGIGSNCYVCSGYAVYSEGHTATSGPLNGQQVDKFTQAGSSESGTGDYDPAWNNPMGMMMKVVRTNIGAFNADNGIDGNRKTGHLYPPAQAADWIQGATPIDTINTELDLHATWIEVLCPRAISFCYGDPNYQSVTGMPCLSSSNTINANGDWSESVSWGDGGVPLEIFCSIPVYSLRTWQTVQRSTMAVIFPFNGATKPPLIPNMSYLNVSTGNIFPYDKADGKAATQYFLNYVPFFRAVTSDWVASKDWGHTGPWSSLRELQGLPQSEDEYKSKLGLKTQAVSLHAPNYNYTVNSADPKVDSETLVHFGWEMMSTADGYAGARMPREFVGESTDSYQTSTYSTITRNQSFNSGTTMWGWEDLAVGTGNPAPYNNQVLTDSFNFQGGIWGQPNYSTDNRSNRAHLKLGGPTIQEANPSGDFIIKNANGKAMNFYFSFNIAAGAPTDNLDYTGNKPWYNATGFSPPGTFSVPPTDVEIGADVDFANGSKNFIKGIDNLPPSKFASKLSATGNPVVQDPAGLVYGTLVSARDAGGGGAPTTTDYFIQSGDLDQMDYANILSQLPTLFYARFYDPHTKASEIMYCAVLTYKVYSNNVADSRTWTNSAAYYGGTNLRPPNSQQETVHCPIIVKGSTISANQGFYYSLPQFHIIQRDVLGEGKKAFGAGSLKYLPKFDGAYFNIVNFYANTSHEISIDDAGRELFNYGEADITKNKQYVASVADTTTQYGLPTGGEFYINTRANLPGTLNGVVEYTGTRLRLNTDTVRTGLAATKKDADSSPIVTDTTGKMSWNIHYDFIDLELDAVKSYFSPSDVGNLITEQLHKPSDLYKSYVPTNSRGGGRYDGGTFKNTAGKYPTNSLFRGIHGPSFYQTPSVPAPTVIANNQEDPKTGGLAGIYREGDFCFFSDVSKSQLQASINAYAWCEGKGCLDGDSTLDELPADGKYIVWPRNRVTKMNIYPMTDSYHIKGYGGAAVNPRAVNVLYEQPFDWMDRTARDIRFQSGAADYENRYALESTFMSQFIGTNNAALVYNENVSKFEWQYFHQPVYSEYKDIGDGKFVGADIIARIWAQNMDGVDNHDRHGGINVVNWSSPPLEFGGELNRRDPSYINPLTGKDTVGSAFMGKLGFNQYWQKTNSGRKAGGYSDTAQDDYFPLGTTKSDFDISQAKPYTQVSNLYTIRNTTARKIVNTESAYDANGLPTSTATKINFGSLDYGVDNTENSLSGMVATSYGYDSVGSTNTAGTWYSKAANNNPDLTSTTAQATFLVNASALQSYAFINTFQTPPSANGNYQALGVLPPHTSSSPFPIAMSNLNLDDVKHPYIEVEVSSSPMRAPELPKKTTIGYFLIMSDLIDRHEFLGSINNGSPLKCLGLLSKNYENNDFFFSFQSPVQFYVKQDRVITSIKTEILTPNLEDPIGLDFNSSVIYTIIRENSVPEPDVAPVSLQQAYDYDIMEQLSGQLGINGANPQALMNYAGAGQGEAQMGGGGFAGLRKEIVQNVLNPSQNSPLQIDMSINSNLQRMSITQRVQLLNTLNTTDAGAQTVGLDNSPSVSEPNPMGELAPFVQTGPIGEKIADGIAQSGATGEVKSTDTTPNTYEAFTGEINSLGKRNENNTPSHDINDFDPDFVRQKRLEAMGKRPKRSDSAREQLAEQQSVAQKAAQPFHQVGLTEFYQAYRNQMSGGTKSQWDRAIKKGGVQIEDPRTWHGSTLRHWQGIDKDFHWGKSAHKKLGNKQLNLDGRTKINNALDEKRAKLKRGIVKKVDLTGKNVVGAPQKGDADYRPTKFKIKHKSGETSVKDVKPQPNWAGTFRPKPTQGADK